MKEINYENIDIIREDLKMCFSKIERQRGVIIKLGNTSYDNTHFTTKITVLAGDGSKKIKSDFMANCKFLSIPEDWFKKEFIYNNEKFIITGINTNALKFPLNYKSLDTNKEYKCKVSFLKSIFLKEKND